MTTIPTTSTPSDGGVPFYAVHMSVKSSLFCSLSETDFLQHLNVAHAGTEHRVVQWQRAGAKKVWNVAVTFPSKDAAERAVKGQRHHKKMRAVYLRQNTVPWKALKKIMASSPLPSASSPSSSPSASSPPSTDDTSPVQSAPSSSPSPTGTPNVAPQPAPTAPAAPAWLANAPAKLQATYQAHKARYHELVAPFRTICSHPDLSSASEEERQSLQCRREACGVASDLELKAAYAARDAMITAEVARVEQVRAVELARIAAEVARIEAHCRFDAMEARMEVERLESAKQQLVEQHALLAALLADSPPY
ncbi:hypothetical protein BOTBODRAFT_66709 [Botryobasidium botryosum FD-172 SS1]|uniref:RRM domain-containing protein n=1 Tax=Botryobasidium botryosum (strain FD-172 SS1) TaxID=930990 RepID=A0A067MD55_BOTB1|nr:hypothetical protein BOTBODRAFT_66709 [Botryobasidium botryosum FD-172 SS1]